MNISNYPIFTIIMRNYSYEQADAIAQSLIGFKDYFAIEVTLNTNNAYDIIEKLVIKYGDEVNIGAGTVRNIEDTKKAINSGANFLLGPHTFTKEMIDICKHNEVLAIPSGMTPSEVNNMFELGADIVKVFPASVVGPKFFKDIQAPLGKLPLMAVGGVSPDNATSFLKNNASYVGIGSSMFTDDILRTLDKESLINIYKKLINSILN